MSLEPFVHAVSDKHVSQRNAQEGTLPKGRLAEYLQQVVFLSVPCVALILLFTGCGGQHMSSSPASGTPPGQSTGSVQSIDHVVFMLQENHSFDNYFGMLNPYRKTNEWNVGDDGKEYDVDGIDDKLNTISNQDDEGTSYPLFKFTSTCVDDYEFGLGGKLWRQ